MRAPPDTPKTRRSPSRSYFRAGQVLTHGRALGTPANAGCGPVAWLNADVREAGNIIGEASQTLDLSAPVGLLLLALLPDVRERAIYDAPQVD